MVQSEQSQDHPIRGASHTPIVCVVLVLGLFISIETTFPGMVGAPEGAQQRDVLVLVLVVISFFVGFSTSRMEPGDGASKLAGGSAATAAARRLWPGVRLGRASGVRGFLQSEEKQWERDAHVLEQRRRQGVALDDAASLCAVMGACARCDRVDVALEVFGLMFEKGTTGDSQSIDAGTAGKFFKLVAENLDEERARDSGLWLLEAVRSHGLAPTVRVQNRLIRAWRSEGGELPEHVARYFLQMEEEGVVELSAAARQCVAAARQLVSRAHEEPA